MRLRGVLSQIFLRLAFRKAEKPSIVEKFRCECGSSPKFLVIWYSGTVNGGYSYRGPLGPPESDAKDGNSERVYLGCARVDKYWR